MNRLPSYDLPTDWTIERLKFVADVRSGITKGRDLSGKETIELPYLRVANVQDGYLTLDDVASIAIEPHEEHRFSLRAGDVLMNEGGDNDKLGRGAVWEGQIERCLHQNHVFAVRPKPTINPYWLSFATKTDQVRQFFFLNAKQSTNLASISATNLKEAPIILPPLDVQELLLAKLNARLNAIDTVVTKKKQLVGLLQEKRAAIINQAVTKGLDPSVPMKDSGVPWIGAVPAHWDVVNTRVVARLESGHTPSRNMPEYWVEDECTIPWFSLADVWQIRDGKKLWVTETNEKISQKGINHSAARLLPAGTVMVSRTASVGFSAIMQIPMATTQDFVNWVCGSRIRPEYLLLVFRSMEPEFRRLTLGSTHQTIYMPDVRSFCTPLPPIEEQDTIVADAVSRIGAVDSALTAVNRQVDLLREYRQALITAAVTGQLDITAEPACL